MTECYTCDVLSELILLGVLTLIASSVGTLSGFGTSTIMVPAVALFFPLPVTLLFVGIIHWFGDIWKILLFRSGVRWRLLLLFGGSGLLASYLGASLLTAVPELVLSRLLGGLLAIYVGWLWYKPTWRLPTGILSALVGGTISGFVVGIFGVGGEIRAAFLSAYGWRKEVYLFTNGAIALLIDSTRLVTYWSEGFRLPEALLWGLLVGVPVSFLGAWLARRVVHRISPAGFRLVIAVFLGVVAVKLLIWPG